MGHEIIFIKRQSDKKRDETIFCPKETKGEKGNERSPFQASLCLVPMRASTTFIT